MGKGVRGGQRSTGRWLWTVLLILTVLCSGLLSPSAQSPVSAAPPVSSAAQPSSQGAAPEPVVPDQPVGERVAGRTAYTRTERNTDGSYTTTLSARPLHWQDKSSREWKPFDNTLRPADSADSARGYAYTSKGNGASIGFGKRAEVVNDRPVLRVATENASLVMTALGANPSGMAAGGAKLSYTEAYPDTDLRYTLDNERVKEDIVLKKAPATTQAATYRYDLDLEGVTATKHADGAIEFKDPTGKAVLRMPAPFMTDSSGQSESGYSNNVVVTLTQLGAGKVRLEYAPDLAWLRDAARVYPVTLDPSVEQVVYAPDGTAGQDAAVYEAAPWDTTAHGATATLEAGRRPTDGYRRDSLVQFPALSDLAQDSIVTSASLKLYAASGAAGTPVQVLRNTAAWDEAGVTWATAPGITPYVWDTVNSAAPGWNSFDVGDLARAWVSGQYPNHGVRLMAPNALAGQSVAFVSSDSTDTLHHPQLVVRYVPATRYGLVTDWTYSHRDHGSANKSSVNISTGNVVFQHNAGSNTMRGFTVDLKHTYNSQDSYGQTAYYDRPGAFYGENWTFSQNLRLYGAGDGAMVLKDGSGGNWVYARNTIQGTAQQYFRPRSQTLNLTKDLRNSTDPLFDPARVYTLAPITSGDTLYFDAEGKLTRRVNANGEYLTYSYDASDRLVKIADMDGRRVALEYQGLGTPARLSRIIDATGRVSAYAYSSYGNLLSIKDDAGTVNEATTTMAYSNGNHLLSVTDPGGMKSNLSYKRQYEWEGAGSSVGWFGEAQATVVQSGEHAFHGTGSLKLNLSSVTDTGKGRASTVLTEGQSWSSMQGDLMAFIYAPAGTQLNARLVLKDASERSVSGPTTPLSGGAWTIVRMPDAHADPVYKVRQLTVEVAAAAGTTYTGAVWLDNIMVKGVIERLADTRFGYYWDGRKTTVSSPDAAGTVLKGTTHLYDRYGTVTGTTVPADVDLNSEVVVATDRSSDPSCVVTYSTYTDSTYTILATPTESEPCSPGMAVKTVPMSTASADRLGRERAQLTGDAETDETTVDQLAASYTRLEAYSLKLGGPEPNHVASDSHCKYGPYPEYRNTSWTMDAEEEGGYVKFWVYYHRNNDCRMYTLDSVESIRYKKHQEPLQDLYWYEVQYEGGAGGYGDLYRAVEKVPCRSMDFGWYYKHFPWKWQHELVWRDTLVVVKYTNSSKFCGGTIPWWGETYRGRVYVRGYGGGRR